MKTGTIILTCVLLIVLAIPLFADQTLVNPVGEVLAISTMGTKEGKDQVVSAPIFEVVAVKPAEIVLPLPIEVESTFRLNSIQNAIGTVSNKHGGVRRVNLGRH